MLTRAGPRAPRVRIARAGMPSMPAAGQSMAAAMAAATDVEVGGLPRVKQELVDPPFPLRPEQVASGGPAVSQYS